MRCLCNRKVKVTCFYDGVAEGDWKKHYYNHTMSFRNKKRGNDTAFLPFYGSLRNQQKELLGLHGQF